jgi:hypothetical protein
MRILVALASMALLSACGGGGESRPSTGNGPPPVQQTPHTFANPTEAKTYSGIGGAHSYSYSTSAQYQVGNPDHANEQRDRLYAGDASTARNSGITLTYNPRDAVFELTVDQPLGNADTTLRFQDPVHRTNFGGERQPQSHTPNFTSVAPHNIPGIQYLEAGSSSGIRDQAGYTSDASTFFHEKPGTSTRYVSFAGYLRNQVSIVEESAPNPADPDNPITYLVHKNKLERGVFAYGERTTNSAVPTSGTGTFNGAMVATLVYNPRPDTSPDASTYFQWMNGTAQTRVNFASNSFEIDLAGTVMAPQRDRYTSGTHDLPAGSTFNARGSGRIDLVHAGGFLGNFQEAYFTANNQRLNLNIAGSSVDGAFFGPRAEEVGGGFRIVGGTPDQRIDILGAFTGRK